MRFTLVHGGLHGAWCWDHLVPELERLGHVAVSMDLPGAGERRHETPTLAAYCEAVLDLIRPGDVIVGHSMGAAVATLAVDSFLDVRHVVYLAGPLPVEGKPIAYQSAAPEEDSLSLIRDAPTGVDHHMKVSDAGTHFSFDLPGATACFYHDCPPEVARWAWARMTPQHLGVISEPLSVPRFWEADLPRSYIQCAQDRAWPEWLSAVQARRLGVTPLTIDSSHSPFLSRPAELANLLVRAVPTKPHGPLDASG